MALFLVTYSTRPWLTCEIEVGEDDSILDAFNDFAITSIRSLGEYADIYDVPAVVQEHVMPHVVIHSDDSCSFTDSPGMYIFFGDTPDSGCVTSCTRVTSSVD